MVVLVYEVKMVDVAINVFDEVDMVGTTDMVDIADVVISHDVTDRVDVVSWEGSRHHITFTGNKSLRHRRPSLAT